MRIDISELQIRNAGLSDVAAITDIYNEAITNGVATFDTEIKSIEDRIVWLNQHGKKHPVLVACFEGKVVAWASLSKWSDRAAYDGTAEVSIYVHQEFRDMGVGSILFAELVSLSESLGLHYLLSRITQGNETSINLHIRNGFSLVGVMHEVGHKFCSYLDVTLMEKVLKN
ncbi:MAG: GNAT family N-acetyltransferase [Bacteroidia bacterium]|nr:GNAT family N-acetyltransferase [Bacteroidia bacterium]MCF8426300.1 GNAT family N-acetyltransferase [Bacteroidia bacterium]MCF8446576.1 GNAT family N-acetyltransferase [Bacteroidia bacterium]